MERVVVIERDEVTQGRWRHFDADFFTQFAGGGDFTRLVRLDDATRDTPFTEAGLMGAAGDQEAIFWIQNQQAGRWNGGEEVTIVTELTDDLAGTDIGHPAAATARTMSVGSGMHEIF